jgi:hypothetical protein
VVLEVDREGAVRVGGEPIGGAPDAVAALSFSTKNMSSPNIPRFRNTDNGGCWPGGKCKTQAWAPSKGCPSASPYTAGR